MLPRYFTSLDSIFCCKAVPGVGTDFAGVLIDNDSMVGAEDVEGR